MELPGIKGMWSLKSSIDEAFDTFLVVSFISETRILAMNIEDELEDTEIGGFLSQVQTLFCHDAVYNQLVQVCFASALRQFLCRKLFVEIRFVGFKSMSRLSIYGLFSKRFTAFQCVIYV